MPKVWKPFIKSKQNKISLCDFLSNFVVEHGNEICGPGQSIVTAGGFTQTNRALYVDNQCRKFMKELESNHEESDSRVIFHIKKSFYKSFLLYSPDTDVYHIALPLLIEKNVIVQLQTNKIGNRFLSLDNLRRSLDTDDCLENIPRIDRYKYIRMIFICSGCDNVSSFYGHMKKYHFLDIGKKYSKFILYGTVDKTTLPKTFGFLDCPPNDCKTCNSSSMCQSCTKILRTSVLGFYRLIGCLYFKNGPGAKNKHLKDPVKHFKKFIESKSGLYLTICIRNGHSLLDQKPSKIKVMKGSLCLLWMHCIATG